MALVRCPICGRNFDTDQSQAMPFCSSRCRLVDLGRWLNEGYPVPVPRFDDPDDLPEEGGGTPIE